jgi:hypothetical protein
MGLLLSAAALLCSGCGTGGDGAVTSSDPYRPQAQQALSSATSDFEKAALADLQISRLEYEEAVERYVSCMQGQGLDTAAVEEAAGYYSYRTAAGSGDFDAADSTCRVGTVNLVESLYVDKLVNPRKRDVNDAVAACLTDAGLVPRGYTGDMFAVDSEPPAQLPFDVEAAAAGACLSDPFGSRR